MNRKSRKAAVAITALTAFSLISLAALVINTQPEPIESKHTVPIVYDKRDEHTIRYRFVTCPVCNGRAISSNGFITCQNPECDLCGIPMKISGEKGSVE